MAPASSTQTETCFLSYSRADEHFALRFANDLRSLGVVMWVDQLNIRPSEHWDRAIERALRSCRNVVVILSPRAVESDNVADEISLAIDSGKSVIPVMLEPCRLPLRLARMHLIDATGGYEDALKQCLAEISSAKTSSASVTGDTAPSSAVRDPNVISVAKRQLASIIGPIAEILVDRAASRAASVEGLYSLLTLHIRNEADRKRFVSLTSQHDVLSPNDGPATVSQTTREGRSICPDDLERIASILTSYLGPIAPIVARKEGKASRSVKDLLLRLAPLLRSEADRADFFSRARAASLAPIVSNSHCG